MLKKEFFRNRGAAAVARPVVGAKNVASRDEVEIKIAG
jgi:hypothetical protein